MTMALSSSTLTSLCTRHSSTVEYLMLLPRENDINIWNFEHLKLSGDQFLLNSRKTQILMNFIFSYSIFTCNL